MSWKTIKKISLFLFIAAIILVAALNYRTQIFRKTGDFWSLGYGTSDSFPATMDITGNPVYTPEKLRAFDKQAKFLADPFFVYENGAYYIFFEHKKYNIHPAEIGVLKSADGKKYDYLGTVLKEKFHLSYPQVFKYKNEYYMVPESQAANHVLLYKAYNFPFDWRITDTLMANIQLKDPTIYLSDTLNIMVGTDDNMTMHMYRADSLKGKWSLHDRPKVLMGTESRPGGRFIVDSKGLVMPTQNASKGYGYGLSLYRLKFDNGGYNVEREKHLYLKGHDSIIEFAAGMHHLDIQKVNGKYYYVYDGLRYISDKKTMSIKAVLKSNYYDLKNFFLQIIQ